MLQCSWVCTQLTFAVLLYALLNAAQGRFKQPSVQLDSLVLGSDFVRPLNLPASPWISHAVTWLAHKLGGGVSVDVTSKQPHILAPLIAAAQVVHVAQPGQQPDLLAPVEDMQLYDAGLVNTWTGVQEHGDAGSDHVAALLARSLCLLPSAGSSTAQATQPGTFKFNSMLAAASAHHPYMHKPLFFGHRCSLMYGICCCRPATHSQAAQVPLQPWVQQEGALL